jgi:class 3 adenylate cyclase
MTELPTGTATFMFTDIEGSTRLVEKLGPDYGALLARHDELIRTACAGGGAEVGTEGDSFFAVFGTAVDPRGPFSKTAGLTIGLVIAFDIMAFGPYTGAAMNPARWFGPALASGNWDNWYVWIIGPIAGGIIAAVVYATVFLKDRELATP